MKNILVLFAVFLGALAFGQKISIQGTVESYIDGKTTEPLFGAEVFLKNAKEGDITGEKGSFSIKAEANLPDTLIIRASGYYADTAIIAKPESVNFKITLYPEFVTEEVIIKAKRDNSNVLRLDPRNVENLTQGELRKAACCNLSESFETNATVDVSLADGVSGSKRIQMMGLNGRYTQLQFENIPFMHNLDQAFGLTSVPGTWISSIQITKGAGSVTNGYESMAGLINLEYMKPDNMERMFVNGYGSIQGRAELNVHGSKKINDKLSTAYFVHGNTIQAESDRNNDGFRDIPLSENIIVMNRWKYATELFRGQIGVKASHLDQKGGELGYERYTNQNEQGLYGVGIRNTNVELFGKTGFLFKEDLFSSIGIVYYMKYNELNTVFGNRKLDATEKRGYVNAMYETILGNTNHKLKSGLSFVYDDLEQLMDDQLPNDTTLRQFNRTEIVPGIFSEYTYTGTRSILVLGARADYHNLYDFQFTPRANYKYDLTERMDVRLTAGRGFRVSNYVTDNLSLMATNLPWIVDDNINPEVSWNFGASWLWDFKLFDRKATWTADFYHTMFENQLVVDRDESSDYIRMRNLDGESFSNVFQTDIKFEPLQRFEVKAAYKWLDVKSTMGGELKTVLMVPTHRGFVNLAYESRNSRWMYDLTLSVFGAQRLAQVTRPDGTLTENNMSEVVPMLSGQITHKFKRFEVYVGGENLLDYRLENPIIDAENPFGERFDATRVYASIFGVNVYGGFRISIGE
ncbi:TonB-dependent receptor [Brumimicrobium aurantiacum]|uniref:TonB-dependent receptor n=1 Tax=Brumimicrobium aurantiacum TaxID=1737063 RepID=A0A3E1EYH0_9FLAO|nr:TonB-dependent receptor [Brumimicrobium aurantiacum]RFC54523.1 TonB-dependent receptor [Brumimicrobium aurantiacum]